MICSHQKVVGEAIKFLPNIDGFINFIKMAIRGGYNINAKYAYDYHYQSDYFVTYITQLGSTGRLNGVSKDEIIDLCVEKCGLKI